MEAGQHTPPAGYQTPRTTGGALQPGAVSRQRQVVGDFEIIGKLGQGGMGTVYRAQQISLCRLVALKVLPSGLEEDEQYIQRFQREATIAAGLSHPNLVHVHTFGQAEGMHYIAMELVEGENLRQFLKRGALDPLDALRICAEIARGLQYGWERAQLIHRDIKPSNIYLSADGAVKVGDLGLAKSLLTNTTGLTQTGAAMGTAHYMSPEQARGEKNLDIRADIYSLGCTLFELLTGRTPYEGSDGVTIIRQHLDAPLPAILKVMPGCPIPLARLVGKMLRKHRHERQQSYEELLEQIASVTTFIENGGVDPGAATRLAQWREVGGGPSAEPTPARPAPAVGQSKTPLYAGLAGGILILAAASFFFFKSAEPKPKVSGLKVSPPSPSASGPANTPEVASAGSALAAEQWLDLLQPEESAQLMLTNGAVATDHRLTVPKDGRARIRPARKGSGDGAIRYRSHYSERFNVSLRVTDHTGIAYVLFFQDPLTLQIRVYPKEGLNKELAVYPLARAFQVGEEFELELRLVGQRLTAGLNGTAIGQCDVDLANRDAFGVDGYGTDIAVLSSLDFLDLDPAASALPSAVSRWQAIDFSRMTSEDVKRGIKNASLDAGHLLLTTTDRWPIPDSTARNSIIRATVLCEPKTDFKLRLRVDGKNEDYVPIHFQRTQAVLRYVDKTGKEVKSQTCKFANSPEDGAEATLELACVGTTAIVRLNGEVIGKVDNLMVDQPGTALLHSAYARFSKVEYLNLDNLPEAEARKLAGLDAASGKVIPR